MRHPLLSPVCLMAAVIGLSISTSPRAAAAADLGAFAQCISDSGATFYGAHWCPYCARQKKAFGKAARQLPYRECFKAGTRERLQGCERVKKFPTWEFADGTVRIGLLSLETLATHTDCRQP